MRGWNVAEIQARFRRAVDAFEPDYVIITDSWNMKPLLAEAVRGYPYFLLYQAQENICPLNNLRLLGNRAESGRAVPAQPARHARNLLPLPGRARASFRGAAPAERELAGVGTREYDQKLRRSLAEAEAVLALNPLIAAMLEPYSSRVASCPGAWTRRGFRGRWRRIGARETCGRAEGGVGRPAPNAETRANGGTSPNVAEPAPTMMPVRMTTLFMAAVAGEFIKGYHVAHEACRILRQTRSDFELVVTFDPAGQIDEFTRSVGWCSQADLPRHYRAADICLVPTIAQDSLSRTSVEAMASGHPGRRQPDRRAAVHRHRWRHRPLCASPATRPTWPARSPGCSMIQPLRREMGLAGRKRFEQDFIWETVIERHFRPLLALPPPREKETRGENHGI